MFHKDICVYISTISAGTNEKDARYEFISSYLTLWGISSHVLKINNIFLYTNICINFVQLNYPFKCVLIHQYLGFLYNTTSYHNIRCRKGLGQTLCLFLK